MAHQISMLLRILCLGKARTLWLCLIMFSVLIGFAEPSAAAPVKTTVSCSDDESLFKPEFGEEAFDMIKEIITKVDETLKTAAEELYLGIIGNGDYQAAMTAAVTAFIIIYGVAILFGLVPVTLAQAAIRLLKFAFVFMLIGPFGWEVTSEFVGGVFNDGTLEIINSIIALSARTSVAGVGGCPPMAAIDLADITAPMEIFKCAMSEVMNPRIFVILFATFTTGPHGPIMGLALGWALYSLFMMLIRAFQVYVLSMIVRALLIGMSPLFFAFMWFEKTKPIFMGWVNQLINFSLQPIMLFAFLAFFLQLVTGALMQMVPANEVEVCFVKATAISGGQQVYGWKFKIDGDVFEGAWTMQGPVAGEMGTFTNKTLGDAFPITPISILVFLALTYIASEMATVVTQMAAEMSQGYVKLDDGAGADPIRNLAKAK